MRAIPAVGVLLLLALGLGACGDQPGEPAASGGPSSTPDALSSCARATGRVLAELDLDGDGVSDQVRASADASCPGTVVARTAEGTVHGDIPAAQLKDEPRVLTLPGRDAQLLTTRQEHPRGGFQVRVFGAVGPEIVELSDGGAPLVPFVATDVSGFGVSAACGPDRSLRVLVAEARAGGAKVDVVLHTYRINDSGVEPAEPVRLAKALSGAQLRQRFPGVARNAMFENC